MDFSELFNNNEEEIIEVLTSGDLFKEKSSEPYEHNKEQVVYYNLLQYLAFRLKEDKEFYRNLLQIGINKSNEKILNHQDSLGNTLLHYLAMNDEEELVDLILDKKIKIKKNLKDEIPQSTEEKINQKIYDHLNKKFKPEYYKEIDRNSIIKQDKLGDYNVYHLDTNVLEKKENNKIIQSNVHKYPGNLYIILHKLTEIINTNPKIKTISVCIKKGKYIVFSESYEINSTVQMNETLLIPIEIDNEEIEFKIYACIWETDKTIKNIKVGYFYYTFDEEEVRLCHNVLIDKEISIYHYTNIYRMFKSIFYTPVTNANKLFIKMCYISKEGFNYVEAPTPNSTASLYNWLIVKQISEYVWFRGYCHVKTVNDTLWKRRMILWQGIHLLIYNEYSGAKVNDVIMTHINKKKVIVNNDINSIQLTMQNGEKVQLCFDSKEMFSKFEQGLRTFLAF